eukprot:g1161.t1
MMDDKANPLWNGGRNHIFFHFFDSAARAFGKMGGRKKWGNAMVAQASAGGGSYSIGHDVSVGLLPTGIFTRDVKRRRKPTLDKIDVTEHRGLLVSFRGSVNTDYRAQLGSRDSHAAMAPFGDRVHIAVRFSRALREKRGDPGYDHSRYPKICDGECERDNNRRFYGKGLSNEQKKQHEYANLLLNSTFSLCPEGEGRATFRMAESLRLGAIPVLIAGKGWRGWTGVYDIPFDEPTGGPTKRSEPWYVSFRPQNPQTPGESYKPTLRDVLKKLAGYTQRDIVAMRRAGRALYERCYSSAGNLGICTIEVIEARVKSALKTKEAFGRKQGIHEHL